MRILNFTNQQKEDFMKLVKNKLYNLSDITKFEITKTTVKEYLDKCSIKAEAPTLIIDPSVYIKMLELVRQSPVEISWHCMVDRKNTSVFKIYDLLMFPQINSGTGTTTDDTEYANWMTELILDPEFNQSNLRCHGHSHANMKVFSSAVDDAYQQEIINSLPEDDYYIFIIMNKTMDMFVLIYDKKQQVIFETQDIDIIISAHPNENDIVAEIRNEIKTYCTEEKIVHKNVLNNYGYSSYWDEMDEALESMPPSGYRPNYHKNNKSNYKNYKKNIKKYKKGAY